MNRNIAALITITALAAPAFAVGGGVPAAAGKGKGAPGSAAEAQAFIKKVNEDLLKLWVRQATADWINSTHITDDTERMSAATNDDVLAYLSQAIKTAARYSGVKSDPETERMLYLLRVSSPLAAPADPAKRSELSPLVTRMQGIYGKAKWCGADGKGPCRDLQQLSNVMKDSRKWDELLDAWAGWHSIGRQIKPHYPRFVELANEGAREIGFKDTGDMWKAAYDMPSADFEKETDRLWQQVKPLYEQLHCYVRAQLSQKYGKDKVPENGPIPAHLLGNMWAQEWGNIYSMVEPYPGQSPIDIDAALKAQKYDELKLVKLGESFFTSLGLDPLPKTFWERSMFKKPRDREVVCHASAWDVQFNDDLRIKMCVEIKEEDMITIHHELGHDYYFHYYYKLPPLFQQGANDGFHEAIGDALTLSITPVYLKKLGLINEAPKDQKGLINFQMKNALDKVAFLPFGKLIDQWRWDVFAGKSTPATYNSSWWELRRKYQGIAPPVARTESDFDPGAKYHVPANVPYTRYFLARLLQFQFHRALCQASGWKGPLHECSIYGNKEAGAKLKAMLALGASRPWPEALQAMTGQKQIDASALLEYFTPLQGWLKEKNAGRKCGW